jgi:uncharacterized membrane protein (UPF0127 family)
MRCVLPLLLILCGCSSNRTTVEDFNTHDLILPGGQAIKVETVIRTQDLLKGLAFRNSIAPDHGMLFVHEQPGKYSFWMYQHLISLDMIWMDEQRKIVEIVENAPPCTTAASKCPHFGGTQTALYALELGAGMVKKYKLKVGDSITW